MTAQLAASLTARAKVALALAIAERVLPCMRADSQAFSLARNAMDDAWAWEEGAHITAGYLYDKYTTALREDEIRLKTESATLFLANVVIRGALYYTIWRAHDIEWHQGVRVELPEGVYEVSDKMLDFIYDRAKRTTLLDDVSLSRILTRLERHRAEADSSVGEAIMREEFAA